ncbi:hypothetical protein TSAR_000633 [Trichomalopsis sarcophagae]|uniref:Uncharacterized protein n=1 Tax=Trichomalopsis sarcophagae TaxID=543379 RepID=A0A232EPM9_9HYME|nr:hypothetical protein TSAR_000633 [Trichomalopsis sarcophagae]
MYVHISTYIHKALAYSVTKLAPEQTEKVFWRRCVQAIFSSRYTGHQTK